MLSTKLGMTGISSRSSPLCLIYSFFFLQMTIFHIFAEYILPSFFWGGLYLPMCAFISLPNDFNRFLKKVPSPKALYLHSRAFDSISNFSLVCFFLTFSPQIFTRFSRTSCSIQCQSLTAMQHSTLKASLLFPNRSFSCTKNIVHIVLSFIVHIAQKTSFTQI